MTIRMVFATLGTLVLLSTGVAHAQTATTDKPAAAAKKTQAPRTEKSLACSKQADEKGLHGSPRKKFMRTCKKA